jgi:hypothetical protein
MKALTLSVTALLPRLAGRRRSGVKKVAKRPYRETGRSVHHKTKSLFEIGPPSASLGGCFAVSLEVRSVRPPGQEGRISGPQHPRGCGHV